MNRLGGDHAAIPDIPRTDPESDSSLDRGIVGTEDVDG